MQIVDKWIRDMPQQFQGKRNIEVLVSAFARQLQEIFDVFGNINTGTDLNTATGKNLDYVGSIIPLTRKEAGEMEGTGNTEPVISDERYRQFLRYQLLRNTSECTYPEIMEGLEIIYGEVPIFYSEVKEHPATLHLTVPKVTTDEEFLRLNRKFVIRPSGVGFYYTVPFYEKVNLSFLEAVDLPLVVMRMAVTFWRCRVLDGTWLLDGNCLLDAARQTLPMRLVLKGIAALTAEGYLVLLRLHGLAALKETVCNVRNVLRMQFPFWDIPMLDGMWLLDGGCLLDAVRQPFPIRLVLKGKGMRVQTEEMLAAEMNLRALSVVKETAAMPYNRLCTALTEENTPEIRLAVRMDYRDCTGDVQPQDVILKKNLWYLDGAVTLGENRKMNAEIRKEALA